MATGTGGRRRFVATAGAAAAAVLAEALAGGEVKADEGIHKDNFIRAVQRARIFDLSHTWDENSPIAGVNPSYEMELNATHAATFGTFGDGKLSFASEIQKWSGQHGAPSIDAIGHIGRGGRLFHGVDAFAATSNPDGIGASGVGANLDIAHYPKRLLVNRGVLLDVARVVKESDEPLDPAFPIDGHLLAQTAKAQGVRIRRGDTVLVRTGWGRYFTEDTAKYSDPNAGAGVDLSGARFLVRQGARVVGNDTLTFEVRPPIRGTPGTPGFEVFPVHMFLIPDNGVHIIENYYLEEIARHREYEFLLVVPPLKIRGGTGSALRSFALVP